MQKKLNKFSDEFIDAVEVPNELYERQEYPPNLHVYNKRRTWQRSVRIISILFSL